MYSLHPFFCAILEITFVTQMLKHGHAVLYKMLQNTVWFYSCDNLCIKNCSKNVHMEVLLSSLKCCFYQIKLTKVNLEKEEENI